MTVALLWSLFLAGVVQAQTVEDAVALSAEVATLHQAGKYSEAIEVAKRLLAILETAIGPAHPGMGPTLTALAELYRKQGRYNEAEPLYLRSLAIREKALGPEHPDVATALNTLASLYRAQGRHAEAEQFLLRSLTIRERTLGTEHPDVALSLTTLASLYQDQGRFAEAEPLFRRVLAIQEKAFGFEHTETGAALNNLANLFREQGRYGEAEPLFRRDLAITENALGPGHPSVGTSLNNLASLLQAQSRKTEAEALYRRSLAVREKGLGPDHPDVGTSLNNLAGLYKDKGRYAEAEALYRRGLAIREKALGPEHPQVAISLSNLADLYRAMGRTAEAEPLLQRSLAMTEKALGPEHPQVALILNNLALIYSAHGRYAEAGPLLRRSLTIRERMLGPEHPAVRLTLNNLAWLALARGDWAQSADYWQRSNEVIQRRVQRGLSGTTSGSSNGEPQQSSWQFAGVVKVTHLLAIQGRGDLESKGRALFETAQWAMASEAAASLAQMAARSAKDSPSLSRLVRERQDLAGEWQVKDKLLIAAKSNEPARRNAAAEKALTDRLAAIDTRLEMIDAQLTNDFPDYAELANPAPVSTAEVQAQLRADEALVLFFDTDDRFKPLSEETFVWLVTKDQVRWVRSNLGTAALTREVAALRCGLDATAWDGDRSAKCTEALGILPDKSPAPNAPLPFDHARAHKLYLGLFGGVADMIEGKHLLIVPSGPLTRLPFQVLVTKDPSPLPARGQGRPVDHRTVAWLARTQAMTILPAVSSLKALRRVGKPSAAPKPMLGIGNPLLDGPDARFAASARRAREKQRCPETRLQRVVSLAHVRAQAPHVNSRGGLADVADIKGQVPLPETADELCAVARDVKAAPGDILLGAKATEHEIKRLNSAGKLAHYRLLHFATHGVLSGQLDGISEPGLILTPPAVATEMDDGYLSASEIAALKLDADWVILSACNTAAGAAGNAEALSGLARAFLYAQARALLVSHWEVYSDATVKLITGALREISRDQHVGPAEALRRAMLALIDTGNPEEAHPAYWAPFVLVGEGARR